MFLIEEFRASVYKFADKLFEKHGIDDLLVTQASVLFWLCENNGRMQMKDVANAIKRESSTATYLVKKLEKDGYVIKEKKSKSNQKASYIRATEKAWALKPTLETVSNEFREQVLQALTLDEMKELLMILSKCSNHFTRITTPDD
jgi:DNA-binding MarR family transcriptional regulator